MADLNFVATQLLRARQELFRPALVDDFAQAVDSLQSDLPALSDPQFYVLLAQPVVMAGDAHTYLHVYNAPGFQILPLHIRWLDDRCLCSDLRPVLNTRARWERESPPSEASRSQTL